MRKKIFSILVILASGFALLNQCGPNKNNNIRIGVMTWAGVGPAYIAKEKGFFGNQNFELVLIDDSKARQAAFASGDIDIMITNIDQHPREILAGLKEQLLLVSDISNGGDGIVANKNVKNIYELRGKRIAYTFGTTSDWFLFKILDKNGLSINDVTLVQVDDPSTAITALHSGSVDAAVTWEPIMSQSLSLGNTHQLATSKELPNTIFGVFVGSEKISNNKDVVYDFLNGWFQALTFLQQDPISGRRIMSDGLQVNSTELEGMLSGLVLASKQVNKDFFSEKMGIESTIQALSETAADYWISRGVMSHKPDLNTTARNAQIFFTDSQ